MENLLVKNEILEFEDTAKKITKMRICIISTYNYTNIKNNLQNFAIEYCN